MGGFWKKRFKTEKKEQRSQHFLNFLKSIRTWQLILILIPLLFLTATFLRFDNLKMQDLKNAVLEADRAGEDNNGEVTEGNTKKSQEEINTDLSKTLKNLKTYTESHTVVNFLDKNGRTELVLGTGPFYLEHQYNRLASEALKKAQVLASTIRDSNPNGNIYAHANAVCQPQAIQNRWSWNSAPFIACMTGEIAKFPTTDRLTEQISASIPSTSLFRYDFASPIWSPTLSGLALLLSAILIIVIIVRLITWSLLRLALLFLK